MATSQVIVAESGKGKFVEDISIGQHKLIADEPKASGGNDLGPSPYDFILAGLGACTCMTLRVYAEFKKIPLKKVIVKLAHSKVYAKDCENCENNHSMLDHINRSIALEGNLDQDQKTKLLEIANKCPVHRTLSKGTSISTELVESIN